MPPFVCQTCHHTIPSTSTRCPSCGTVLKGESKEKLFGFLQRPSKGDLVILGSIGMLGVLGIGVVAFSGRSYPTQTSSSEVLDNGKPIPHQSQSSTEAWKHLPPQSHVEAGRQFVSRWKSQEQKIAQMASGAVGQGKAKADTFILPEDVQEIRKRLSFVKLNQSEYASAQTLLKQLDGVQTLAEANEKKTKALAEIMLRKTFAERLQNQLLDQRMNAEVKASGKDSTVLTIRYVLATDVMARDLQKSGILDKAWVCGFQTVKLAGTGYVWDWKVKRSR